MYMYKYINLFVYVKLVISSQCVCQTLYLKASTMKNDLSGSCSLYCACHILLMTYRALSFKTYVHFVCDVNGLCILHLI